MWTWPVEVPRKMLSEPDDIAVISAPYAMLKGFSGGLRVWRFRPQRVAVEVRYRLRQVLLRE